MNKTTLTIFIISLIFAGASLGGYIYIEYMIDKAHADEMANTLKAQAIQDNEALADKVESSLEARRGDIANLSSYLVPDAELVSAVETFESLGPQAGVVSTIQAFDAEDAGNHTRGTVSLVKARIEAKGDWKSISKFLGLVQNIPYKSNIKNISLRSSQGGVDTDLLPTSKSSQAALWTTNFEIEVYKIK